MEGRANFVATDPDSADVPTGSAAIPPAIDTESYARIRGYFERKYDHQAARWQAFRLRDRRLKYTFGVAGAIALVAAIAAAAMQYIGHA
jgi:hypothetical protein